MKVVMISPHGIKDGIADYTSSLLRSLKRKASVQIFPWNFLGIKKFFGPLIEFKKIKNFLKTADVVHVQYAFGIYFFLFLPLLSVLKRRAKLVLTLHEEYDNVPFSGIVKSWHYFFYRFADCLIVHAPANKNNLPRYLRKKTSIVPLGVVYRKKINEKRIKGQILLPGFINKWKGHDIMLKSFPAVLKEFPRAKLLIAGKAHDKKFFREILLTIEKMGLKKNVEVIEGYLGNSQFEDFFKKSDIGVLPYTRITGSAILSQMIGWNLPAVLSDLKPLVEFTRNKGLYFKAGNAQDLAQKILLLLKNSAKKEEVKKIFKSLAKYYSWENIALRTLDVYKNCGD